MDPAADARFEGLHCTLVVRRPAPGVTVVLIEGTDVGELGDAPFSALAQDLTAEERVSLFIDARATRGATIDVSGNWAAWLGRHQPSFRTIEMLTGSRFIQLTADFVRRFAGLGDIMRIYTDPTAFDDELARAIATAGR